MAAQAMQATQGTSATSALDLTTRSLDLTNTILSGGGIWAKTAVDVRNWLARERLDEKPFSYTMTIAQNLATPNRNGDKIVELLHVPVDKIYPLTLGRRGTLGTQIIRDPQLRWLATTVTVLLAYSSTLESAMLAIQKILLQNLPPEDRIGAELSSLFTGPVLKKTIESIAIHISSDASLVTKLPGVLQNSGLHTLGPFDFAEAISDILQRKDQNIYISLESCFPDLLAWIINHWQGRVIVILAGENIYDEAVGPSNKKIIYDIQADRKFTTALHPSNDRSALTIQTLSEAGAFPLSTDKNTYRGWNIHHGDTVPRFQLELYQTHTSSSRQYLKLSETEIAMARVAAKNIVNSIMFSKVEPRTRKLEIVEDGADSFYEYAARFPALIQSSSLDSPLTAPRSLFREKRSSWGGYAGWTDFHKLYPEVEAPFRQAMSRCNHPCSEPGKDIMEGCLQMEVLKEIVLLVAHALVDAAGGPYVSNIYDDESTKSLFETCLVFLNDIARHNAINFRTWFFLIASAVTGLLFNMDELVCQNERSERPNAPPICWSAGGISVIPLRLQIDQAIEWRNSWGIKIVKGSLAQQFADRARVESGPETNVITDPKEAPPLIYVPVELDLDQTPVEVRTSMMNEQSDVLRMITVVQTHHSTRLISLGDVYLNAIRNRPVSCLHESDQPTKNVQVPAHVYSFDEILRRWGSSYNLRSGDDHPYLANLSSDLQRNVAISFACGSCLVQSQNCCMRCFVQAVLESKQWGICYNDSNVLKFLEY